MCNRNNVLTPQMLILSLWINLMHPCWIKVLISFKNVWAVVYLHTHNIRAIFMDVLIWNASISTVYVALVLATGIVLLISSVLVANHKVTHAALWHGSSFYTGTAETSFSHSFAISICNPLFSPALYLFRLCLLFCLFKQATCQATQQGCLHVSGVLSFLFLSVRWFNS